MKKKLTIKDIAHIAKVSASTVSMVLNDKPGVNAQTRDRVLKIIKGLDYTPNLVARSLSKRHSLSIAMLITSAKNGTYAEIIDGAEEVLTQRGYSLSIFSTHENKELESAQIKTILDRGIDGVISVASHIDSKAIIDLHKEGFPVICALRRVYGYAAIDFVGINDQRLGFIGTEHLIKLGHTRIGVINGPQYISTGVERAEGCQKALREYNVFVPSLFIKEGNYTRESGYNAAMDILKIDKERRPTAFFAANDHMALGAFMAVWDMGLRVPDDVAIVGAANVEAGSLRRVDLTTVEQRNSGMGKIAAEIILKRIEDKTDDMDEAQPDRYNVVMEPQLIIRKSCGLYKTSEYLLEKVITKSDESDNKSNEQS